MEIGNVIGLKCPNCGASLAENQASLQKCMYCGTTVRIEDANKYLEYLKGFIVEWMRTALPLGVSANASSSVDMLARHNIFIYNILPRLNAEFGLIQANSYDVFSKPLISPLFVSYPYAAKGFGDTKTFFSYDAKIAAVQPFAVSVEDQTSVKKMGGTALALAHILIGLDTLKQNQISYKLAAENFGVASTAIASDNQTLSKRLQALKEIYLAMDDICSKNLFNARTRLDQAKAMLEDAKVQSAFDINLSLYTEAIEQEIETANAINRIADIMENSYDGDQLSILTKIGKFLQTCSTLNINVSPNWRSRFENLSRYNEIANLLTFVFAAKKGEPSIKMVAGQGSVLFPFWVSDVRYTFGTGALWMKKGICVTENALVAATFPLVPQFCFSPSELITDIFSSRPIGSSITSSIVGSETSISIGAQVAGIVQNARVSSATGYKIIPSLTTASEAKQLMDEYIQQVSRALQGKMQIASCNVTELIFVPADLSLGYINFNGSLGYLQPRKVGDITSINGLLL